MEPRKQTYYPTTIEAVHLLVLYVFLQSLVDFPLAMYDYNHDTNLLSESWIGIFSNFFITVFIFYFGFKKTKNKFKESFALQVFNPVMILPIVVLFPGLQYLVGFLNVAVDHVLPAPPWFWELFERFFKNKYGFWGTFLKVAFMAPIIEESLFRGIIMHGLMRNYKPAYAIFLSGLLFSLFHLNPWQMTYTFFLGLFLGWLMIKTRSLPLCILAHSMNNLLVLLSITYQQEIASWSISNQSVIVMVILSIVSLLVGLLSIHFLSRNIQENNH